MSQVEKLNPSPPATVTRPFAGPLNVRTTSNTTPDRLQSAFGATIPRNTTSALASPFEDEACPPQEHASAADGTDSTTAVTNTAMAAFTTNLCNMWSLNLRTRDRLR